MTNQARTISRYHCIICRKKVSTANHAYIREDRPFGARLCLQHAEIVGEHFSDIVITTLKLAVIRKRLRAAGHEVDKVGKSPTDSQTKRVKQEAQKLISQIYSG